MNSHAVVNAADKPHASVADRLPDATPYEVASVLFDDAMTVANLTREGASRALGVSRQRVEQKCSTTVVGVPPTLVDIVGLIEAGGRPLDAAQAIVNDLQQRIDARRGAEAAPPEVVPTLAMAAMEIAGKLCASTIGVVLRRSVLVDDATQIRTLCSALRKQIGAIEAAIRWVR